MKTIEIIRYMQLEKAIGELKALAVSYFDNSSDASTREYQRANDIIESMISELRNNLG